jgi:hypothetical protein
MALIASSQSLPMVVPNFAAFKSVPSASANDFAESDNITFNAGSDGLEETALAEVREDLASLVRFLAASSTSFCMVLFEIIDTSIVWNCNCIAHLSETVEATTLAAVLTWDNADATDLAAGPRSSGFDFAVVAILLVVAANSLDAKLSSCNAPS